MLKRHVILHFDLKTLRIYEITFPVYSLSFALLPVLLFGSVVNVLHLSSLVPTRDALHSNQYNL